MEGDRVDFHIDVHNAQVEVNGPFERIEVEGSLETGECLGEAILQIRAFLSRGSSSPNYSTFQKSSGSPRRTVCICEWLLLCLHIPGQETPN